ncbi:unnamed protein product [Adineta steineri]|uniref:Transmembrane protein 50A n=1 Tax=Adineta steineri TaxID=433720 RepID=A0A815CA10_9BILA|nr:unnamed protein product [Adineta steineri]CAF1282401.1 unnamed protein product [Adineta steineri]
MLDSVNKKLDLHKYFNRNAIASILSGALFAFAWWIIIDLTYQYPLKSDFNKIYYIIGIVATFALILANSISNSQVLGDTNEDNCLGQFGARSLLFISFLLAFGSLIASAWLLFGYYISHKQGNLYPIVMIFVQNLIIFISTLILKFGRREEVNY